MIIDRRVRVAIRFDDGRTQQQCAGPSAEGLCPLADQTGRAACAGAEIIALRGTRMDGRLLRVGMTTGPGCPLAQQIGLVPAPWD